VTLQEAPVSVSRIVVGFLGCAALLAALPPTTSAQRLSFAPQIGIYIPTEKLHELATGGEFSELEAGPSFGARLGLWFGNRLGVEASGAYIPTTFKLSSGNVVTEEDAKLFTGTGQVVLFLVPRTSPLSVFLSGGVGVVSRGGVAFTDASDKTDVSGVFGAGAAIRLGPIALTAGAELFAYAAGYEGSTQVTEKLTQRDIHMKLGVGIPFGGRIALLSP
jgi:hypothetical protein